MAKPEFSAPSRLHDYALEAYLEADDWRGEAPLGACLMMDRVRVELFSQTNSFEEVECIIDWARSEHRGMQKELGGLS